MKHYSELNVYSLQKLVIDSGAVSVKRKDEKDNVYYEYYSEIIFSVDIETTSYFVKKDKTLMMFDKYKTNDFYKDCLKQGEMYIWMVGINDSVYYGRTWKEFQQFFQMIKDALTLPNNSHLKAIVYIHNLSFDFHFLMNALGVEFDIFAKESRGILTSKNEFFDFRCSYYLTMMGLEEFCESYDIKYKKKSGQLDYNVMRTPLTKLSEKELEYCEFDILCLYEIIVYHRNIYGSIYDIPLTQTGKIRRDVKKLFSKNRKHHQQMKDCFPASWDEFKLLNQVYQGGYTHANYKYSNKIIEDVHSWDITSSYPYELCVEKYPMTPFCETTMKFKEIDRETYAFIIDFEVEGLNSKLDNSFLSISKAYTETPEGTFLLEEVEADNGRIKSCKSGRFCMTDVDFFIFRQVYEWNKIKIKHLYISDKDYLPKEFIEYILKLYKEKTELKGIKGKEAEYTEKKQFVNGLYGMTVTKFVQDKIEFNKGVWKTTKINSEIASEQIEQQSKKVQDLNFAWGVWCSAYARSHLWTKIIKLDKETAYCDTDSLKGKNFEKMKKVFEEDNIEVLEKIKKVCEHYQLDESLFSPKDKEGKTHTLGLFDYEGKYDKFKTLGAKKYCVEKDGKIEITVSGINKKTGSKAIHKIEEFRVGKFFDYDESGKNGCVYNDNQEKVVFPDGWVSECHFGICIFPTTYDLGITEDYDELITNGCYILE